MVSVIKMSRRYGTDDGLVCGHKSCIFRKEKFVTGVVLLIGGLENESPDIGDILVDLVVAMLSGLDVLVELFADKAD